MNKTPVIIGLMSGTSLDGLDIVACQFWQKKEYWEFNLLHAETYAYLPHEIDLLKSAFHSSGMKIIELHHQYGKLLGEKVKHFCEKYQLKPKYVASHGHTIFHQPQNGFTFQLGHGANIAAKSGITTICDFRTSDVAYGGQGAPLVPIGDELLFAAFDYCLNLGGISNISFNEDGVRKAFDIGICNMALNELAQQLNLEYDKDGLIAQSGSIDNILLTQLQNSAKENQQKHQSLGYEWYLSFIKPIINQRNISTANKMRTFCEFIACQISEAITSNNKILATGGGAKNKFLMQCLQAKTNGEIIIPNNELIDFKEALIFAFLGMLRVNELPNSLSNVTGALKDVSGGCIYLP